MLLAVAILGWLTALGLAIYVWRHRCPIDPPTRAVLLNAAGLPESIRTLRLAPPETYSKGRGSQPAMVYHRIATAAVYQTETPR